MGGGQGLAVLLDRVGGGQGSEGRGGRRWDPKGGAAVLLELFPPSFRSLGFMSCLLEHPLRLSVAFAQIKVGMWRRNGHSMAWLAEAYYNVQWYGGGCRVQGSGSGTRFHDGLLFAGTGEGWEKMRE